MLSDHIKISLETLGVTISDVARAGGCTPSNLNRVKNGARTPPPFSPTMRYLTNGLIEIARERNLSGELCSLCGADLRDSGDAVRTKLIEWLYEDEPPYTRAYKKRQDISLAKDHPASYPITAFTKRFDSIMRIADLSNRRLAIQSGLDPSYISRIRRGERIPRYNSPYLTHICESILADIIAAGKLSELSELTSMSETEILEEDGAEGLRRWLFGYGSVTGYLTAEKLMGTIASINELIRPAKDEVSWKYNLENILESFEQNDCAVECANDKRYVGIDGIRSAVTRFLTEMIRNGEQELLLYSDQSMDWMEGDYRLILKVLMLELIRREVKISIIHTVDRSMPELISAVEWWMPLYLSGAISSYYCRISAGKRFSHTMFIRPGVACIAGTSAIGLEKRAVYEYSTEIDMVGLAEDAFNCILNESQPLVHISECDVDPVDNGFVRAGEVMVKATQNEVKILRIEPPKLMFTFTHPMICKAFSSVSIVLQ